MSPSDAAIQSMIAAAQEVRHRAYAKLSNYKVGATVLTKSGASYSGCNVENASYGLTICAERHAIGAAVAAGIAQEGQEDPIVALAVATKDGGSMCGACRQVLREFGDKIDVYEVDESGKVDKKTIAQLLPDAFTTDSL